MKQFRIQPKEYISERFVMDFFDHTKKDAIKIYKQKFPQFTLKELSIK